MEWERQPGVRPFRRPVELVSVLPSFVSAHATQSDGQALSIPLKGVTPTGACLAERKMVEDWAMVVLEKILVLYLVASRPPSKGRRVYVAVRSEDLCTAGCPPAFLVGTQVSTGLIGCELVVRPLVQRAMPEVGWGLRGPRALLHQYLRLSRGDRRSPP